MPLTRRHAGELEREATTKTQTSGGSNPGSATVNLFRGGEFFLKFICIHPRFASLTSHHFNESYGYAQEFRRRGKEFLLLINTHASPRIAAELRARAVLDDPTFRLEWSFRERSRRFLAMLHSEVDADLVADDCVMLTVSTQLEAHALVRWLRELPRDQKPWVVILFLSDRWNRSGREEYARQAAEFRILNAELTRLAPEDARRLIFCTLTDLLAEELGELLGTQVELAPIPLPFGEPGLHASAKIRPSPRLPFPFRVLRGFRGLRLSSDRPLPRVAVLGGMRREKGSHLIPDIVRACRSNVQVEFLIQLENNDLSPEEAERLKRVAKEPHVIVIPGQVSMPAYHDALKGADIALFPYEIIPYRKRTSGVFAEAVAYGKPVVATRGTWMAEQIEAGRAAGVISEELRPDSVADAIARCVRDLESLRQSALDKSAGWRKTTGLTAFVDFVEEQLARRSRGRTVSSR
ncbi:MAG: glycosyltransferase [Pyrinomonadaceae bacterium]